MNLVFHKVWFKEIHLMSSNYSTQFIIKILKHYITMSHLLNQVIYNEFTLLMNSVVKQKIYPQFLMMHMIHQPLTIQVSILQFRKTFLMLSLLNHQFL